MTDAQKATLGGYALIVFGAGLILFGGNKTTSEDTWEFFGFTFGRRTSEPMSRGESLFWGIALIVGGLALIHYN